MTGEILSLSERATAKLARKSSGLFIRRVIPPSNHIGTLGPPLDLRPTFGLLHIKVRLPVLLCAVKTVEGDFRFRWTTTPNVGQTHKENPNLVRILYMVCTLPVLLCAVKTVEGDFRFRWTTTPNVGQTHKENPNLVRILYMVCTLNDIHKQYNKLHEH